jgi:hypothetical protein
MTAVLVLPFSRRRQMCACPGAFAGTTNCNIQMPDKPVELSRNIALHIGQLRRLPASEACSGLFGLLAFHFLSFITRP